MRLATEEEQDEIDRRSGFVRQLSPDRSLQCPVRKEDRSQIWVAVEASNNIAQSDIERVRQSAEALGVVFGQDAIAVVAGYNIHPLDQERADGVGVAVILIEENN